MPSAMKVQSPNHWTARQKPDLIPAGLHIVSPALVHFIHTVFISHSMLGSALPKVLWVSGNHSRGQRSARTGSSSGTNYPQQEPQTECLQGGTETKAGLFFLFRRHSFQHGLGPFSLIFPFPMFLKKKFLLNLPSLPPTLVWDGPGLWLLESLGKRPKADL